MNRKTSAIAAILLSSAALTGCASDADIASFNISKAADNFEIIRRVVFINGITDKYILSMEGRCALGNKDGPKEVTVTCKTGPNDYKKHFLGLSDNVTFFAEQLENADVSSYHYRIVFKPQAIIPDVDLRVNPSELKKDRY